MWEMQRESPLQRTEARKSSCSNNSNRGKGATKEKGGNWSFEAYVIFERYNRSHSATFRAKEFSSNSSFQAAGTQEKEEKGASEVQSNEFFEFIE
jgi:hypothetical protein